MKLYPDDDWVVANLVSRRLFLVIQKEIWLNNELQTTPVLGVLTYFLEYELFVLFSLYVFLLTSKIFKYLQRINEVGFLIEAPTSFSSTQKLAKQKGKWLIPRGTHQKKSGGHAQFF